MKHTKKSKALKKKRKGHTLLTESKLAPPLFSPSPYLISFPIPPPTRLKLGLEINDLLILGDAAKLEEVLERERRSLVGPVRFVDDGGGGFVGEGGLGGDFERESERRVREGNWDFLVGEGGFGAWLIFGFG